MSVLKIRDEVSGEWKSIPVVEAPPSDEQVTSAVDEWLNDHPVC